jgi:DNA-binding NtrC family response regulator
MANEMESKITKVLVVEDDKCLSNVLGRCLRQSYKKVELTWVTSEEEAEKALKADKYQLVVADYTLCGFKNGFDLWRYCYRTFPHTPFVMISGLPIAEYLNRLPKGEPSPPFLPKPFSAREFSIMINPYLLR